MTTIDHMYDHEEKTPVDPAPIIDPFEMLSKKIDDVAKDTKLAVELGREANTTSKLTYDLQLELKEENKKTNRRIARVEAYHVWLPALAIIIALYGILYTYLSVK